ncbi:ATP-binding protein [Streptomyces sp. NPDC050988]|uniref:ATP-binding protein n=1 Tax=Streptomyces sp. NPDC050988 TaxID=3365637 RepID=UPI00378DDB54
MISVIGSSPGVGKSTLCRALADWLAGLGASVDHFEEADVLARPAFRPVAEEFESTLVQVMKDLTRAVEPADVTVVYVHDDPATALRRAVEREGSGWEDWYVGKLAGSPGTSSVHDLPSAAAHLRSEADLARRLLAGTPWQVLTVDAGTLDAQESFDHTRHHLTESLRLPTRP